MNEQGRENSQHIWDAFVNGDQAAFEQLHQMFHNRLMRFGSTMTPDRELVKDTIQDLFVWLFQKKHQLKKVGNFELYIFAALRNNLKRQFEKDKRRSSSLKSFPSGPGMVKSQEFFMILGEKENFIQRSLENAMEVLPDRQKQVIYLKYFEQLSYQEIAEIMNINNQVARNFAYRAIKKLKVILFPIEEFLLALLLFLI